MSNMSEALKLAAKINPEKAAQNCGFDFDGDQKTGQFRFAYLNKTVKLDFPSSCFIKGKWLF